MNKNMSLPDGEEKYSKSGCRVGNYMVVQTTA